MAYWTSSSVPGDEEALGLTAALWATESLAETSLLDVVSVAPVDGEDALLLVGSMRSNISISVVMPSQMPSCDMAEHSWKLMARVLEISSTFIFRMSSYSGILYSVRSTLLNNSR